MGKSSFWRKNNSGYTGGITVANAESESSVQIPADTAVFASKFRKMNPSLITELPNVDFPTLTELKKYLHSLDDGKLFPAILQASRYSIATPMANVQTRYIP